MRQRVFAYHGSVPAYGEALPNGAFAVVDDFSGVLYSITTHLGDVPSPLKGLPLHYVRIADDGVRVACCIGKHGDWVSDRVFEWNGTAWQDRGSSCGAYPAIYDHNDILVVVPRCIAPTYGQGYLFVDGLGNLVPTDDTYAGWNGVHNRIDFGDVAIGQGHDSIGEGAVLRFSDDGVLRRLTFRSLHEDGQIRNILVRRDGDNFAITAVDYDRKLTTITWATLDELRAMPPVAAVTQPPVIVTSPPVTPLPPTEEPKPVTPNHVEIVHAVNMRHPHLLLKNTHESVGEFTERAVLELAAFDPNWGHVSKQEGQNQYNGHAVDATKYRTTGQVVDFVESAGNGRPTSVVWIEQPSREGNEWMPAIPVNGSPTPAPSPNQEVAELRAEIARLRGVNAALEAEIEETLDANGLLSDQISKFSQTIVDQKAELDALKDKPHNCKCEAKIFGIRVPCKVVQQ